MNIELAKSLLGLIAPQVVIDNFELVSIQESTASLIFEFEEFADRMPSALEGKSIKHDGFMNKIELHTFPQKGKSCYLHIRRRRWTDKTDGTSYSNTYEMHSMGMKATDELGVFLKKNDRIRTNKF